MGIDGHGAGGGLLFAGHPAASSPIHTDVVATGDFIAGVVVDLNHNYEHYDDYHYDDDAPFGDAPRSMAISTDGESLYVVNYNSDTVSKILTADMTEVQELAANDKPIGITYDPESGHVWVSTYSGSLMVFADR